VSFANVHLLKYYVFSKVRDNGLQRYMSPS